jgi:hypothetical protein
VRNSAPRNSNIRKVKSREDEVAEQKLQVRQAVNLWLAGVRTSALIMRCLFHSLSLSVPICFDRCAISSY